MDAGGALRRPLPADGRIHSGRNGALVCSIIRPAAFRARSGDGLAQDPGRSPHDLSPHRLSAFFRLADRRGNLAVAGESTVACHIFVFFLL